MGRSTVTIILEGKTYSLDISDTAAIRAIPRAERAQLIDVLKAVELQDKLAEQAIRQAAVRAGIPARVAGSPAPASDNMATAQPHADRLGSGDVDDLMKRLIMEERKRQKPPLTAQTLYKGMAIGLAIIAVLVLFF